MYKTFNPSIRIQSPTEQIAVKSNSKTDHDKLWNDFDYFGENLNVNLKLFLLFGKLIGLVPIQGLSQNDPNKLDSRSTSVSSLVNCLIAVGLSVNASVGLVFLLMITKSNQQVTWSPTMLIFYSNGVFLYIFFNKMTKWLIRIIRKWNLMKLHFTKFDAHLYRDANLIAGLIFTSAILENVVAHLSQFPVDNREYSETLWEKRNSTALEIYYYRAHSEWAHLVSYSPPLAIYVFMSNKLALYSWNYMDCLISIVSRALYFKFKALCTQAQILIQSDPHESGHPAFGTSQWRQLTQDYDKLIDMFMDIEDFLSPLIFVSYGLNVYFICQQLNLGLTPTYNNSFIVNVYSAWSFLHLVCRFMTISIAGARCSEWAHKVQDVFQNCPKDLYIMEVERTERFLTCNVIGLSGLNCFVITKSLILQIAGVIFTFEIFILQTKQQPQTISPTTCNPN